MYYWPAQPAVPSAIRGYPVIGFSVLCSLRVTFLVKGTFIETRTLTEIHKQSYTLTDSLRQTQRQTHRHSQTHINTQRY